MKLVSNLTFSIVFAVAVAGCEDTIETGPDGGIPGDGGGTNVSPNASIADTGGDGGVSDGGGDVRDIGTSDSGSGNEDSGVADSGPGGDSGSQDAGSTDMGGDGSDGGPADMGGADSGPTDMGNGMAAGDCISGASGTHAVRFKWQGNQGSTAYVSYEINELPDTSRWKAGAYARSFGYTPQFGDTFLGIGGLIMDGTKFMDVELSTVGLSSIQNVTIAILGRSYNTTASGSYSWMTFDGSGAAPRGSVANSTPYQWYRSDATAAFVPGNGGVLLRIEPGGPSNSLVVNSVELCFDAS